MVLADHPYVQGRSSDGIGRMHMKGASGAFQVFLENTGKKNGVKNAKMVLFNLK